MSSKTSEGLVAPVVISTAKLTAELEGTLTVSGEAFVLVEPVLPEGDESSPIDTALVPMEFTSQVVLTQFVAASVTTDFSAALAMALSASVSAEMELSVTMVTQEKSFTAEGY